MQGSPKKSRLVIVEDDQSYAKLLRELLASVADFDVVDCYSDAAQFLQEHNLANIDLVILDIQLPGMSGVECVRRLRERFRNICVVMLTVCYEDKQVFDAFLNGANGYLLKDSKKEDLITGIREALAGHSPMSPGIARTVIRLMTELAKPETSQPSQPNIADLLSPREYEILSLLADGRKYQEIADQLFVSYDTVKTHIRHVYEKLEVRNKAEAISRFLS